MKLQKGNYLLPFWGAPDSLSKGRDPLGLQTTSLATYARLIPIITNLTVRIRYFGFYCWLLEEYAKRISSSNPDEQKKYIRRAELLIAFMMVKHRPNSIAIPGSDYATNHKDDEYIDIKKGADQINNNNTYWKLSWGAFGQYYVSALRQSALVTTSKNAPDIYVVTNKYGRPLASSFNKNLRIEAATLFWEVITSGDLDNFQLEQLIKDFSIVDIPENTDEHSIYIELISNHDIPSLPDETEYESEDIVSYNTMFRKQSAQLILKYIKSKKVNEPWYNFAHSIYLNKGTINEDSFNEICYGWYYYQMNEYWHYSMETLFWSLLTYMDTDPNKFDKIFIPDLISRFTENIINQLNKNLQEDISKLSFTNFYKEIPGNDELIIVDEINQQIKERNPSQAASFGIYLLNLIWGKNKDQIEKLFKYSQRYAIHRDGNFNEAFNWITKKAEFSIKYFLMALTYRYLINRHIQVAYEKMGAGTKNTLKFQIEENIITYLDVFWPTYTTPRIYSLHQILGDLHLIHEDKITVSGETFINQ